MACEQTSSAANNDEPQKSSSCINDVMFLCDDWESSKGGLATFSREFAVSLAKTRDSVKVHCYVSQRDEQSREDARLHGIPGSSDLNIDWLKIPPSELPNPDIVVGHGRNLVPLPILLSELQSARGCILFMRFVKTLESLKQHRVLQLL